MHTKISDDERHADGALRIRHFDARRLRIRKTLAQLWRWYKEQVRKPTPLRPGDTDY